jgi:hypothetical protein
MLLRRLVAMAAVIAAVASLSGCEKHYFKSRGAITSSGGELAAWTRQVQGCSPDPLDGLPVGQSITLFTFYWDNPVERDLLHVKKVTPPNNLLERLEIKRQGSGIQGTLETAKIKPDTVLDSTDCSTIRATTRPGRPVIQGGRPTVDGTLDLDCQVAGSHLTASVKFSGCEY